MPTVKQKKPRRRSRANEMETERVKALRSALRDAVQEFRSAQNVVERERIVEHIGHIVEAMREFTNDNKRQLELIREKLQSM